MELSSFKSVISTGLLLTLLVFFALFLYFGISMVYHWGYYTFNLQAKRIAQGLYFFVSLTLLFAMLFFIGMYMFNYGI